MSKPSNMDEWMRSVREKINAGALKIEYMDSHFHPHGVDGRANRNTTTPSDEIFREFERAQYQTQWGVPSPAATPPPTVFNHQEWEKGYSVLEGVHRGCRRRNETDMGVDQYAPFVEIWWSSFGFGVRGTQTQIAITEICARALNRGLSVDELSDHRTQQKGLKIYIYK